MNDSMPPADAPADDVRVEHAAPLPPISWLALTAFVLSLLGINLAMGGRWYVEFIPIALAALAILTIRRNGKRGRLLAIFAIIIAVGFGSCFCIVHTSAKAAYAAVPRGLLTILADKDTTPEAKDERLATWAWPKALESDPAIASVWRAGFAVIEAEFGAWSGDLEFAGTHPGFADLVVPPTHGELIPKPPESAKAPEEPVDGGAVWVKALFAKGPVWVCVVLATGDADFRRDLVEGQRDGVSPMVGAIRYFRP